VCTNKHTSKNYYLTQHPAYAYFISTVLAPFNEISIFTKNTAARHAGELSASAYEFCATDATDTQQMSKGILISETASVACSLCEIGKYSNTTDAKACLPCAEGLFERTSGKTSCLCQIGLTNTPADSVCRNCASGKYENTTGTSQCIQCMQGKFTNGPSATSLDLCVECQLHALPLVGMLNDYTVSFENCSCNPGYTDAHSNDICIHCDVGKFKPENGNATCTTCQEHANTQGVAATACSCDTGYSGADNSTCTACGVASYKDTTGSATCPYNQYSPMASTALGNCNGCDTGQGVSRLIFQVSIGCQTAENVMGGLSKVITLTQKKCTTAVQCIITNITNCTCGLVVPAALLEIFG